MTTQSSSSPATAASTAAAPVQAPAGPPCAGCKFLRRKCQPDCVFAPYFPADQPHRFAHVHRVFGASNVAKLLHELTPHQRGNAASSLAYEAEMRLRDPVYGCAGVISDLQHQLRQLQMDLSVAKSELSRYYQASGTVNGRAPAVGHGLVYFNLDHALGFGGVGTEREPLFAAAAREQYYRHHHRTLMASCEADMASRPGESAACDAAFMAADLRPLGGQFVEPGTAGGDQRQAITPP